MKVGSVLQRGMRWGGSDLDVVVFDLVMAKVLVRFWCGLRVLDATDQTSLGSNTLLWWCKAFGGYGGGM